MESLLKQQLSSSLNHLPSKFIIDGEFVVIDEAANQVKPFHDVSVLLGKKEKVVKEKLCIDN